MQPNMGTSGFVWWFGIVEDRDGDPEQLGRVRVRIFNVHSEDKADIDTDMLPWALVGQDPTSAAHDGIGRSPTGIAEGSMVFGFFLDGESMQIPAITQTFAGRPGGKNDLHPLALGSNTLKKVIAPGSGEPASPYKAKYPYNKVFTTESGHAIEIDDTPGAERLQEYHKSGTYHEVHPDGSDVVKIVGDSFDITVKDKTVFIGGDLKITVKGDANITIDGDSTLTSKKSLTIKSPDITIEES